MTLTDFRSVLQVLNETEPDEIYNLAGQSSVGLSFAQPLETLESIATGTLNLLEAIRFGSRGVRLYNASSSECFGNTVGAPADETTVLQPSSPYGVAKAAAHWLVANYRSSYGLYACSGILFNHESPFRPARFVTQKIVRAAVDIAQGETSKLELGNLDVARDWGWAPEYVEAMWLILEQSCPEDYVIATGCSYTLRQFVAAAFEHVGLDWHDHVVPRQDLFRPTDITVSAANPKRAEARLGWSAKQNMPKVVVSLMKAEILRRSGSSSNFPHDTQNISIARAGEKKGI